MQKLVKCKKPANLDEQQVGNTNTVKGHIYMGRYDLDGNYYEQDVCCDRWWKLTDDDEESTYTQEFDEFSDADPGL